MTSISVVGGPFEVLVGENKPTFAAYILKGDPSGVKREDNETISYSSHGFSSETVFSSGRDNPSFENDPSNDLKHGGCWLVLVGGHDNTSNKNTALESLQQSASESSDEDNDQRMFEDGVCEVNAKSSYQQIGATGCRSNRDMVIYKISNPQSANGMVRDGFICSSDCLHWLLSRCSASEFTVGPFSSEESRVKAQVGAWILSKANVTTIAAAIKRSLSSLWCQKVTPEFHPSTNHRFPTDRDIKLIFNNEDDTDLFQNVLLAAHNNQKKAKPSRQPVIIGSKTTERTNDSERGVRRKLSGLIITVRRSSSTDSDDQVAYEVIGKKRVKVAGSKRKMAANDETSVGETKVMEAKVSSDISSLEAISQDYASDSEGSPIQTSIRCRTSASAAPKEDNFHFTLLSDFEILTDYTILLFAQVKRGTMSQFDLERARRRNAKFSDFRLGYPGMRCRHCGGMERGSYYPSCFKNLQACPPTLHSHLLKCQFCPDVVKRALKITKCRHKYQVMSKPAGAQAVFFANLWERIHSKAFNGCTKNELDGVLPRLNAILEKSISGAIDLDGHRINNDSSEHEQKCTPNKSRDEIYSDDLENEYNDAAQILSDDGDPIQTEEQPGLESHEKSNWNLDQIVESSQQITPSFEMDEDFEVALELLRRAQTPDDMGRFCEEPTDIIDITPAPLLSPIPVRVSPSGEFYHNGTFVVSGFDTTAEAPKKAKKPKPEKVDKIKTTSEDHMTRKFTRSDEVLLIRGILTHGKRWKKIWDAEPRLQHIMHTALKDRARSRRFKQILQRAETNPALLDDPDELCGQEDQTEYIEERPSMSADTSFNLFSEYSPSHSNYTNKPEATISNPLYDSPLDFNRNSYTHENIQQEIDDYYGKDDSGNLTITL